MTNKNTLNIDQNKLLKPSKVGEIIQGKIIKNGKASVFLDLGVWGTGIIYGKEFYEAKDKLKDSINSSLLSRHSHIKISSVCLYAKK